MNMNVIMLIKPPSQTELDSSLHHTEFSSKVSAHSKPTLPVLQRLQLLFLRHLNVKILAETNMHCSTVFPNGSLIFFIWSPQSNLSQKKRNGYNYKLYSPLPSMQSLTSVSAFRYNFGMAVHSDSEFIILFQP